MRLRTSSWATLYSESSFLITATLYRRTNFKHGLSCLSFWHYLANIWYMLYYSVLFVRPYIVPISPDRLGIVWDLWFLGVVSRAPAYDEIRMFSPLGRPNTWGTSEYVGTLPIEIGISIILLGIILLVIFRFWRTATRWMIAIPRISATLSQLGWLTRQKNTGD